MLQMATELSAWCHEVDHLMRLEEPPGRSQMARDSRLLTLGLLLTVLVSACGGDSSTETDARGHEDGGKADAPSDTSSVPGPGGAVVDLRPGDASSPPVDGYAPPVEAGSEAGIADTPAPQPDAGLDALVPDGPARLDGDGGLDADVDGAVLLTSVCSAQCPAGRKMCSGFCVSTNDSAHGCGGTSCMACNAANAVPTCSADGKCAIATCLPGYSDCDQNPSNGCETDITSPSSCGGCGIKCPSGQYCSAGGCVASCSPPATLCTDRCVNLATDPRYCGTCRDACPLVGRGVPACKAGVCGTGSCVAGATNCSGKCVDIQSDPANCGACANACTLGKFTGPSETLSNWQRVGETCAQGVCSPCPVGLSACGAQCVHLASDPSNCGTCGKTCPSGQDCEAGRCQPTTWLATGLTAPAHIAIDQTHVYWIDSDSLFFVSKSGGKATALATGQAKPWRIAVDDTHAYWTNQLGGAVMRTRKDGTGTPEVFSVASEPKGIVTVGQYVVWANTTDSTLRSLSKSGGSSGGTILHTGVGWGELGTDGVYVYGNSWETVFGINPADGSSLVGFSTLNLHYVWVSPHRLYSEVGILTPTISYVTLPTLVPGVGSAPRPRSDSIVVNDCGFFGIGSSISFFPIDLQYKIALVKVAGAQYAVADSDYVYWTDATAIGRARLP